MKVAKKLAGKKAAVRKVAPSHKKRAAKAVKKKAKISIKKKAAAKKKRTVRVPGYTPSESGVLVPNNIAEPVPANKLKQGFARAKKDINALAEEIISSMNDEFIISEIELSASFSADGKFLGIGVGGATSIKIRISPTKENAS